MITVSLADTISPALMEAVTELPHVVVNAINRTAFMVRSAEQESMRSVFDRPTPWFLDTIRVQQATIWNPVAVIGPDDSFVNPTLENILTPQVYGGTRPQKKVERNPALENILTPQVYGGTRPQKKVERRMVRSGLMPADWFAVPGPYMPLDVYGNPRSGELMKMLSWLQALEIGNRNPASRRKNKTQREGASYTLIYPGRGSGNLPPGIYKRVNRQMLLMLYFTPSAMYEKRLPWFETAQVVIERELEKKLRSEIYKLL